MSPGRQNGNWRHNSMPVELRVWFSRFPIYVPTGTKLFSTKGKERNIHKHREKLNRIFAV